MRNTYLISILLILLAVMVGVSTLKAQCANWQTGTNYKTGTVVTYNGLNYTSNNDWSAGNTDPYTATHSSGGWGWTIGGTCSGTAPTVSITSPSAGTITTVPFSITAIATETGGSIAKVEFYADATLIGTSTTSPYSLSWKPSSGQYSLTAKAYDGKNISSTSAAIDVTIQVPEQLAINEPPYGMYVVVNGDLGDQIVAKSKEVGFNFASDVIYTALPANTSWIRQVAKAERDLNGGLTWVTIIPSRSYVVDNAVIDEVIKVFAEEEAKGSSFMITIGHEMNLDNGTTLAPKAFKNMFRSFADKLHAVTTKSALVWVPNVSNDSWPWGGVPANGSVEWNELDVNKNGKIDGWEGYEAFYPGDQYVDWVGMDIYNMQSANVQAGNRSFANGISWHFYDVYCSPPHNKPMAIMETASSWRPALGGDELAIKQSWFGQIFNIQGDNTMALDVSVHFPKLKFVAWFDKNKETDWRITSTTDTKVPQEWVKLLKTTKNGKKYFLEGSDFKQLCNSGIWTTLETGNTSDLGKSASSGCDDITIYPNPTFNNRAAISLKGFKSEEVVKIEMINLSGQIVVSSIATMDELGNNRNATIDLSKCNSGIYVVAVKGESKAVSSRLIISN